MAISCPTFIPRPAVVEKHVLIGLWVAAHSEWLWAVLILLAMLLKGIYLGVALGLAALVLGLLSYRFDDDTKSVEERSLAKEQSSNYCYDQHDDIWPVQKTNIKHMRLALYSLSAGYVFFGAVSGLVVGAQGKLILGFAIMLIAIAFVWRVNQRCTPFVFLDPKPPSEKSAR